MNYLIQNAEIIDPYSPFHRKKCTLFIEGGKISKIAESHDFPTADFPDTKRIEAETLKLSVGWFDMRASLKDPGLEHKETLDTGIEAALQGGFTEIAILPNTLPVIQTKNALNYVKKYNASGLLQIHPIAAVTLETEGRELTEMLDLHHHGAVAFSDGSKPVWHSDILVKTLQYLQMFDGLLMNRSEDQLLTLYGVMNEGINSTLLGMKGMPRLAEEMMIQRDLSFLEYAGGKIHFSLISSAGSVALIRQAKQKGLQVTCDMATHQIAFNDSALMEFDTNFKVNPPFRTEADIEALWEGLEDGTIDVLVSDHNPQDEESKNLEFDLAEFGISSLETSFALIHKHNLQHNRLSLEQLLEKFTYNPRKILKLPIPQIAEGQQANLTLFDTEKVWVLEAAQMKSKSKNTPFLGQVFRGKAIAVFNQGKYHEII
ncbi:MAG: dihydroorotase [Microscillaceae bacterium]|nr:dihydroorotase [Microscillaceae bacterium]